ncbi:DUF3060 domain-containing protein [Methylobacterium sp. 77]|uniref:DUF3060 domain-containing protein n=1 Tax=Methylobacterium sp. 77 TaxID=1101192 RepID=UPI00037709B3|nr:DUF3060 domain-containing protein [Methylobacterium sp. 77]
MRGFLLTIGVVALAYASPAQAEELLVEGVGLSRDVDCGGRDVGVYGAENAIALTGDCKQIVVHGSTHTVSFEKATALAISGANHKVTGGTVQQLTVAVSGNTVTATMGGVGVPGKLEMTGAGNRADLILAGPAAFSVSGADHVVEWSRKDGVPNPEVNAMGVKNTIRRKP